MAATASLRPIRGMTAVILTDNLDLSLLRRFPCDVYLRVIGVSEATAICREALADAALQVSVRDAEIQAALSTALRLDLSRHECPNAATGIGGIILIARFAEPAIGRDGGIEFVQAEVA